MLEVLGRLDGGEQVKLQGVRVELGEIEAAVLSAGTAADCGGGSAGHSSTLVSAAAAAVRTVFGQQRCVVQESNLGCHALLSAPWC